MASLNILAPGQEQALPAYAPNALGSAPPPLQIRQPDPAQPTEADVQADAWARLTTSLAESVATLQKSGHFDEYGWPVDNPIGTESLAKPQEMRTADPGFRPAVMVGGGAWGPERPVAQQDIDALQRGSEWLYGQASMMVPGGTPRAPGQTVAAAAGRRGGRLPPPSRRASAGYETVGDPEAPLPEAPPPVGHNMPPEPTPVPAAPARAPKAQIGRMGGNADDTLRDLGLPAYADIKPSTNTGKISEAMLRGGSPARPGQVMDLSETWRVPDVPQTELARIDPNAGKRKGLPAHIEAVTTDRELRAKLRTVAEAGFEKGGGAYWYNAEPLRLAFTKELGEEEGNQAFRQYMRTIGAVSAGSDVSQNIRTASYYNVRERQGRPVQGEQLPSGAWAPTDIESPYGHKMQNTQYSAYRDIASGEPLDPQGRPKRASFDDNLTGNQRPVTVDKHNIRLIGMLSQNPEFLNGKLKADVNYPTIGIKKGDSVNFKELHAQGKVTMQQLLDIPQAWNDVPKANHYRALEKFQQDLADEMGVTPAQLQAALWVGGGRVTGLRSLPTSFMGAFEGKLQSTAQKTGVTPENALLNFIRGKKPLLSPLLGAGLAAGAASDQD